MFRCPICKLEVSSNQALQKHMRKKVPCDLTCKICGAQHSNSKAYHKHVKKHLKNDKGKEEADEDGESEESLVEKAPVVDNLEILTNDAMEEVPLEREHQELLNLYDSKEELEADIGLDDFDWIVKETHSGTSISTGSESVCEDTEDNFTVIILTEVRTTTYRSQNAAKQITDQMLYDSFDFLEPLAMTENLVYDTLVKLHAQKDKPNLLLIKMTDVGRQTTKFKRRFNPQEKTQWIATPYSLVAETIKEYYVKLIPFLIRLAVNKLKHAFLRKDGFDEETLQPYVEIISVLIFPLETSAKVFEMKPVHDGSKYKDALRMSTVPIEEIQFDGADRFDPGECESNVESIKNGIDHCINNLVVSLTERKLPSKAIVKFLHLARQASMRVSKTKRN